MRAKLLLAAVTVLLLAAGCSADVDVDAASSRVPAELLGAIDAFYASIETADTEARIALMHPDIIMMPNHWTPTVGRDGVADMLRSSSGAVFRIRDREMLSIDVSGDLGYTVSSYSYTYHAVDDEPQWHKTKNVHVWRRTDDGWRLAVDIWNSDVPLAAFTEE